MENLLFITEDIKNNLAKDDLLYGATFLSKGSTHDKFALSKFGNYFLLSNAPKDKVEGLIYQVSELFLLRLDRYQDSTTWCYRMDMPVISEQGEGLMAWIYMDDAIELN